MLVFEQGRDNEERAEPHESEEYIAEDLDAPFIELFQIHLCVALGGKVRVTSAV